MNELRETKVPLKYKFHIFYWMYTFPELNFVLSNIVNEKQTIIRRQNQILNWKVKIEKSFFKSSHWFYLIQLDPIFQLFLLVSGKVFNVNVMKAGQVRAFMKNRNPTSIYLFIYSSGIQTVAGIDKLYPEHQCISSSQ